MSRCCTTEIFCRASSSGRAVEVTRRSTSRRSSNRYCSIASRMRAWLPSLNFSPALNATMALRTTSWRKDILPESETLIFSSTERRKRSSASVLAGDRVGHLTVIEGGLDLVQVLLQELLRFGLEGGKHGAVHVFLHPAVVELLARGHQVIDPALLLLRVHARIVLDRILQCQQQLHAGEAVGVAAGDGIGDGVDDEARADPVHALIGGLGVQ